MQVNALLGEAFGRVRAAGNQVLDGLDDDALTYRPDAAANSIAWLLWHSTRIHDDHVAEIAGAEQVWVADGWADRLDLPLERSDTGYGHTSEQVAAVRASATDLAGYHDAVCEQTRKHLATVDAGALDRVIDRRWDPPVTVGARLVSVVNDRVQHLGQAAYVRGLVQRRSNR